MMRHKKLTVIVSISFVLSALAFAGIKFSMSSAWAQDRPDSAVLNAAAQVHGLEARYLEVINTTTLNFPTIQVQTTAYKILDRSTNNIYTLMLDAGDHVLDHQELQASENAAYTDKYGTLDPRLADRLEAALPNERVEVFIWLQEPTYTPSRPSRGELMNQAELKAFYGEAQTRRADAVRSVVDPIVARMTGMGFEDIQTNPLAPAITAELLPDEIFTVSTWEEVLQVYPLDPILPEYFSDTDLPNGNSREGISAPQLYSVHDTIGSREVHHRFNLGFGVPIAQVDVGGILAVWNPFLDPFGTRITQDTTYVCPSADSHNTAIAGITMSIHPEIRGVSPGAYLWAGGSCGGSSSELYNQSSTAVGWGTWAENLGFGSNIGLTPGASDIFYDNLARNSYQFVVASAGNQAAPCPDGSGNITSPGLGYNVIAVGNFDDKHTPEWGDDTMEPCSSYLDPTSLHGDREKPEIAAPGTFINSTLTASPWVGLYGSGANYASSVVTGVSALLMGRNFSLVGWPEAQRAILMATAFHNIQGDERLSDKDGAGGIFALAADDVAAGMRGHWGTGTYTCSGAPTILELGPIFLEPGMKTRITLVWDQDTNYVNYTTLPSADLDLTILDPASNTAASSTSWDNTYEIVQFTPEVEGFYTIQVYKVRCDTDPAYFGWASYQLRPDQVYVPLVKK